jgi:hypothetical protein
MLIITNERYNFGTAYIPRINLLKLIMMYVIWVLNPLSKLVTSEMAKIDNLVEHFRFNNNLITSIK